MRRLLHIQTRIDPLAAELIEVQRVLPDVKLEIVTLEMQSPPAVYADLIEKIFAADNIFVS